MDRDGLKLTLDDFAASRNDPKLCVVFCRMWGARLLEAVTCRELTLQCRAKLYGNDPVTYRRYTQTVHKKSVATEELSWVQSPEQAFDWVWTWGVPLVHALWQKTDPIGYHRENWWREQSYQAQSLFRRTIERAVLLARLALYRIREGKL